MEARRPAELVLEVAELGEECLLAVEVLVELLGPLGGRAEGRLLGPQLVEASFLPADLGLDVVEQGLEEQILVEPVVVDPEGVVFLALQTFVWVKPSELMATMRSKDPEIQASSEPEAG